MSSLIGFCLTLCLLSSLIFDFIFLFVFPKADLEFPLSVQLLSFSL